jgi:hypothetical protein
MDANRAFIQFLTDQSRANLQQRQAEMAQRHRQEDFDRKAKLLVELQKGGMSMDGVGAQALIQTTSGAVEQPGPTQMLLK